MAKTLKFSGLIGSTPIDVEYKTNLLSLTDDNFTVNEVTGLSDAELSAGLDFRQLAYTLGAFKTFAASKGLQLSVIDESGITNLTTGNFINLSTAALSFIAAGEAKTFDIDSNIAWTVTKTTAAWLTIGTASGTGDATVTLTAAVNAGAARTATITVAGTNVASKTIAITQAAA